METLNLTPQTLKTKKNLYYTNDYEWIEFQGSAAYIGLCPFKLAGIKEIDKIEFSKNYYEWIGLHDSGACNAFAPSN